MDLLISSLHPEGARPCFLLWVVTPTTGYLKEQKTEAAGRCRESVLFL